MALKIKIVEGGLGKMNIKITHSQIKYCKGLKCKIPSRNQTSIDQRDRS